MANFRCNSRCGCDFSTKAVLKPDLTVTGTVFSILSEVLRKTGARTVELAEGNISPEEYARAREATLDWLLRTFSGENDHYRSSEDWNPTRLCAYLEYVFENIVNCAGGNFYRGAQATLAMALQLMMHDIEDLIEADAGVLSARSVNSLMWWSRLLTGAPVETLGERPGFFGSRR